MFNDILVAIMCVIALAAGIYCWKMDRGSSKSEDSDDIKKNKQ